MFGHLIGQKDMNRAAWSIRNAFRNEPVVRRNIRTACAGMVRIQESIRDELQPVLIRIRVVVGIRDDFSCRCRQSGVARVCDARRWRAPL